MIKLKVATTTEGGLTVPANVVLDVTPSFITRRVVDDATQDISVEYDVAFDAVVYKDLASYEANEDAIAHVPMAEYQINYCEMNTDLLALTSVGALLTLFATHIEAGIGSGNTELVFPFSA